jgi:hypothetical protein
VRLRGYSWTCMGSRSFALGTPALLVDAGRDPLAKHYGSGISDMSIGQE